MGVDLNSNTGQRSRLLGPGMALAFSPDEIKAIKEEGKLGSIDFELTLKCNLMCRYCYAGAHFEAPNELTTEEILDVIEQAVELGIKLVNLTGGEPLLHKDYFKIAKYVRDKGLAVIGFTDGVGLTRDIAKEMFELQISPCVKLDSLSPEIADFLCGVQGALRMTLEGIDNLIEVGYTKELPMTINCVAGRMNINDIPNVWRFARDKNITPFVARMHPHGRAKEDGGLLTTTAELQRLFKILEQIDREKYGLEGWNYDIPWVCEKACRRHYVGCFVNSTGTVFPCSEAPHSLALGNVRQQRLKDIVSNPIVLKCRNIDKHLKGACKDCKYLDKCYGCRVLAYDVTGDFFEADPFCWHNPKAI